MARSKNTGSITRLEHTQAGIRAIEQMNETLFKGGTF